DKGTHPHRDAYSAFEGTGLHDLLRELGVRRLFVGGLTTEFCVLETVRDARSLGYEVVVLEDGIAPLDRERGEKALEEMRALGASLLRHPQEDDAISIEPARSALLTDLYMLTMLNAYLEEPMEDVAV